MKKITVILACMLVCFLLFTGCTTQKDGTDQDTNLGNSVEIDDTDIAIDTEPGLDTEGNSYDTTFREMLPAPVNGNIHTVLIPEGKAQAHGNIIYPRRRYGKTVSGGTVVAKRHHVIRNGHDAGIAVRASAVTVNNDVFKLRLLFLSVGGKVMPAVVSPGKQRVLIRNRIPPLHVIVHMGERPRQLVVVVPIGHDGDERPRRLVVREIISSRHP